MNWSKAKTISIFFLLVVNLVLSSALLYNNDNRLTSKRENAIIKVLNKNNIKLEASIPKYNPQMAVLNIVYKENDIEELKNIFFGKVDNVKRSVEFNSTILKSDNITLTINDTIKYIDEACKGTISNLTENEAKKIVEQFINSKFKTRFKDYKFSSLTKLDNRYRIIYYGYSNKYKVFSNYMIFDITDKGIQMIRIEDYEISNKSSIDKDICSADEALLSFMYEVLNKSLEESIIIDKIELGYISKSSTKKNIDNRAVPCYSISIKGNDKIYFIDAYTNMIIKS